MSILYKKHIGNIKENNDRTFYNLSLKINIIYLSKQFFFLKITTKINK